MGSDSDDGAIVREATPEVELGPPLELSAPFVPRPATESLWLIRVSKDSPPMAPAHEMLLYLHMCGVQQILWHLCRH